MLLSVEQQTLKMAGLECVLIESHADDLDLRGLFKEISEDPVPHTWRSIDTGEQGISERLFAFENKKRQTRIFYYFGVTAGGARELIGVGTVAARISHSFPDPGFPVIARCFIRRRFRNLRFYFPILKHRFEVCGEWIGPELRGVHLGSKNPRVYHTIKKGFFGLPFKYMGDETLHQHDKDAIVHDFLWLSPLLERDLRRISEQLSTRCDLSRDVGQYITLLLRNEFNNRTFGLLKTSFDRLVGSPQGRDAELSSLRRLIAFAQAIPVLETPSVSQDDEESWPLIRRVG